VAVHLVLVYGSLWPRSRLLGANLLRVGSQDHGGVRIYLTFDDGPDEDVTPRVLEILDKAGAHASFFAIGMKVERHPDLARRIVARGHTLENHSHSHFRLFSLLGPWRMAREIGTAQRVIQHEVGRRPHYFRAPAGLRSPWLGPLLRSQDLALVTWTRRGFDAVSPHPERVLARLTRNLQPGNILVLHDGGAARTADGQPVVCQVLPPLLELLRQRGLQPVALPGGSKARS
jgi:peptidoglycan/xylan/chitin deacetylase (PgdA/CDA1 family)